MYDNPWWYQDEIFNEEHINGYYGFVYCITNSASAKKYICLLYTSDAADE